MQLCLSPHPTLLKCYKQQMRCEAPTSPQEPSCVIMYKELLIRLSWFRGVTYTEAGRKLFRGTERGPCLLVLLQRELHRVTDLDRKHRMTPQLPPGYKGQERRAAIWSCTYIVRFSSNIQYPLCRDVSDAAVAMSLSSVLYGSLLIKCWFRKGLHHCYFVKSGDRGLSNTESFLFTTFLSAPTGLS